MHELTRYRYVGPADVRATAINAARGTPIRSPEDFARWIATTEPRDRTEPFTYVVDVHNVLRLAPRRSEHVACAGGGDVLGAGEIAFTTGPRGWAVSEVSNLSTGYCPDVTSWEAVGAALDRVGLPHPGGFTVAFLFRRCPGCGERNLVKDDDFTCALCGHDLPQRWNIDHPAAP